MHECAALRPCICISKFSLFLLKLFWNKLKEKKNNFTNWIIYTITELHRQKKDHVFPLISSLWLNIAPAFMAVTLSWWTCSCQKFIFWFVHVCDFLWGISLVEKSQIWLDCEEEDALKLALVPVSAPATCSWIGFHHLKQHLSLSLL